MRKQKWSYFTISDLLSKTNIPVHSKQKWFQAMCDRMGLVIEQPSTSKPEYVFVMSLEPAGVLPERAHYSVDPLLIRYWLEGIDQRSDHFLPSLLFPKFVATFLKKLKSLKKKKAGPQPPIAMKQHYLHVHGLGNTQIHVVEQESFIEIGLQHLKVGNKSLSNGQLVTSLEKSCHDVYDIVSSAAERAADSLGLDADCLQYGCISHCAKADVVDHFGKFDPKDEDYDYDADDNDEDDDDDGTLTCYSCNHQQTPMPQQQIWFGKVNRKQVGCVTVVHNAVVLNSHVLN